MKKREERRYLTFKVALRAHRYRMVGYEREQRWGAFRPQNKSRVPAWVAEPHRFAKRGVLACSCRSRHHGRPKEGHGFCKVTGGKYRAAVEDRILWRRAVGNLAQWMRAGLDPLDFEG